MKMKTTLVTALTMAMALDASAKTLTIGIDLSGSNPLLVHENFAYSASNYVSGEIAKLKSGDSIQVKTFGARNDAMNLINQRITINHKNRPEKVAQIVGQLVRALPERANIEQSSTNLVSWLEFSDGFACDQSSEILVITDGIESSSYVGGQDFIEGKKGLPVPDVNLKGCTMTFYGLGAGLQPQYVKTIRKAWMKWSDNAGVIFKAVIP